jgi:hypothetical protein
VLGVPVMRSGRLEVKSYPIATSIRGLCAYAVAALADPDRAYLTDLYRCRLVNDDGERICGKFYWTERGRGRRQEFCCDEHRAAQNHPTHPFWVRRKYRSNPHFLT